jgi:hypothetical protein
MLDDPRSRTSTRAGTRQPSPVTILGKGKLNNYDFRGTSEQPCGIPQ